MRIPLLSWLLLITSICLSLLSVDIASASDQCLGHQHSLLLQLEEDLAYDYLSESTKLIRWNRTTYDCCTWDGVICHEGYVIGLNLSFEGIIYIYDESSLLSFQHLEHLDLSHNYFDSPIPSWISRLTKLTYLNLSNAGFYGQIPIELSSLTSLVTLDLSSSSLQSKFDYTLLTLEDPNLSMLVQNLSELEELYLDGVNISARGNEWCKALSSAAPKLRVLSLTNCFLSGPFDQALEKLQSLSVVHLDNNHLSAPVPKFFSNFRNLTRLTLRTCGLNGTFPREIFQVSTLQILDISGNSFLQGNLPELPKNNALQILELNSTNFSGTLPESIGNLRNLSKLNLHYCQFNGTLPGSIEKLTQLVYLDLSFNYFVGPIPSFKNFKNITDILLSYNSFTGEIPSVHCEGLLNLVCIDLQYNFLNGSIPLSLFVIPSLEEILLSNNKFSGRILDFRTASFSKLHTLDLRGNDLEGPFPTSVFKLESLSVLDLSYNKFNGSIQLDTPQGLGKLFTLDLSYNNWSVNVSGSTGQSTLVSSFPHLQSLALASCKLTEFPYMKNHLRLVHLDLSDNQIHGEIPNWIWEIGDGHLNSLNLSFNYLKVMQEPYSLPDSLNVLELRQNRLQGNIPILPTFAQYVDFSSNGFASSIPAKIGHNLSFLGFYSLSNNSLTGVIPNAICKASSLQILDFSNNNLSGKVPKCLIKMSRTLVTLNLGNNKFRGSIHNGFPTGCLLKILDLNRNSITGKIPKSLANCIALEVLDLGHNKMVDKFPCSLKKIKTLRVLVLQSNKFRGKIRCPNTTAIGTWERLQILDLAHNNLSGEVPGGWLTNWKAMMLEDDGSQAEVINQVEFELGGNMPSFCNTCFTLVAFMMHYFAVTVTVTSKGHEMELVKMLTFYTYIDLSDNNFQGSIPEELGQFKALHFLNLSNNALVGQIPSSLGSLRQLESLDVSRNGLT
ncbi:LRR domain containing protein [Trema orientale]|uniref:LRR domain containing protein n=1 Tax=Trema orientale TaxID=63057 RepID=A0A2P5F321_TREOI|nr:LRR domain containing protein [Trema orientale]